MNEILQIKLTKFWKRYAAALSSESQTNQWTVHTHIHNTAHLQCLMIYRSDMKSADRVLRCITHPTTTKTACLINNKNAEISDRHTGRTEQFTSDSPMMERIFKCQFSELIAEELRQSRYRLGRRRSILA